MLILPGNIGFLLECQLILPGNIGFLFEHQLILPGNFGFLLVSKLSGNIGIYLNVNTA